ncbi:MAG: PKD domain-containing protein, partial [Chloroflexaceae bacterium]|nr:PKD domain-containing protein [Chloroflexaceae bacterium]
MQPAQHMGMGMVGIIRWLTWAGLVFGLVAGGSLVLSLRGVAHAQQPEPAPLALPEAAFTTSKAGGIVSLLEGPAAVVTGVSSQYNASYRAENALDGNDTTTWISAYGQTTDQWMKIQVSGGTVAPISRVRLRSYATNVAVRDMEVRVSATTDDAAAFAPVLTVTAENTSNLQEFTFAPIAARYVQFVVRNVYGASPYVAVRAFEVLTPDGANVASIDGGGASVLAFSSRSSNSPDVAPEHAIDYDTSSAWYTGSGQTTDQWMTIRLIDGGPWLIDRVMLRGSSGPTSPRSFEVRAASASPDEAEMVTVLRAALPADGAAHWFDFPAVPARYVQLVLTDNHGSPLTTGVSDFQVYSPQRGGPRVAFEDRSTVPNGEVVAWDWDFGDGAISAEPSPVHTYESPGTYPVRLIITDRSGLTDTVAMDYTVLMPPQGDITWSPDPAYEGQALTFSPVVTESSGMLVGREWRIGADTATVQAEQVTLTVPDNGALIVALRMTNHHLLSSSVTKTVQVENSPPTVTIAEETVNAFWGLDWQTGLTIAVTDPGLTDRDTLRCDWDSGDGQTTHIPNCTTETVSPTFRYAQPGTYVATLRVTDKDGATASDSLTVQVEKRASRVINYRPRLPDNPGDGDGDEIEVRARLFDTSNRSSSMAGYPLTFLVNGQARVATTDGEGYASVRVPASGGTNLTLTTTFDGNHLYAPSSDTDSLSVASLFSQTTPRGDIVFLFDESGSMAADQEEVKRRLSDMVDQLGFEMDFQLGLVGFGSFISDGQPRILTPLTDDVAEFAAGIDTLMASGGTEPGFSAVVRGMGDAMGFRPDAGVCAIMITDEDATSNIGLYAPETQLDALAALLSRGAVFLGIVETRHALVASDYGPEPGSLAFETEGEVFEMLDFREDSLPVLTAIIDHCSHSVALAVRPDLTVSKVPEQATVQAGNLIPYTITITNASTLDATGVRLTDTMPDGTIFVSADQGGTAAQGQVTWPAFTLPARTRTTRQVTLRVVETLPVGVHQVVNTVSVSDDGSQGADKTPDNNTASVVTTVVVGDGPIPTVTPTASATPTRTPTASATPTRTPTASATP